MVEVVRNSPFELFPDLKVLDGLFKCGICYDMIKTSLMTSCCSHNYCSLCIRQYLAHKNQCPHCFQEAFDSSLRKNRILDDIIIVYTKFQDAFKDFMEENGSRYKIKGQNDRDFNIVVESSGQNANKFTTPKKGNAESLFKKQSANKIKSKLYENEPSCSNLVNRGSTATDAGGSTDERKEDYKPEIKIPSMFSPKKKSAQPSNTSEDKKVECPVCSVPVPQKHINIHLDRCLDRSERETVKRHPSQENKKMKFLVYELEKEKDLRKKIQSLGLSKFGNKEALINRHKRFTILYNASCDSKNPRPVSEIIQQIEREEKEEKKMKPASIFNYDRYTKPEVIEECQKNYLKENKSSFDALITNIRKRENTAEHPRAATVVADHQEVDLIDTDEDADSDFIPIVHQTPRKRPAQPVIFDSDSESESRWNSSSNQLPLSSLLVGRSKEADGEVEQEGNVWRKSLTPDMFEKSSPRCKPSSQSSDYIRPGQCESNGLEDDESDNSISVLINYTQEDSQPPANAIDSQIIDPDFEINSLDLMQSDDDSSDCFVKRKRRKTAVPKPEPELFQRTLRKRKKT